MGGLLNWLEQEAARTPLKGRETEHRGLEDGRRLGTAECKERLNSELQNGVVRTAHEEENNPDVVLPAIRKEMASLRPGVHRQPGCPQAGRKAEDTGCEHTEGRAAGRT